jgi:hypothetical protein
MARSRDRSVAHGKGSWMKLSQSPETAPMPDRSLAQTQVLQLRTSHHSVLAVSQFR